MLLEGVFEAAIPFIGRMLGYIFIEFFLHIFLYTSGYVVIKAVTLGKHPAEFIAIGSEAKQEVFVILIGLLFWLILIIYSLVLFSG